MRLKALVPSLPAELVRALDESCGIKTDVDFLFNSGTTLELLQRLPVGTTSLYELHNHKASVAENAAAPGACALDLVSLESDETHHLRSGLSRLDELLCGIPTPCVIEVSGDKGSGKSVSSVLFNMKYIVESNSLRGSGAPSPSTRLSSY